MALGPIEIVEEDCGCTQGLNIHVQNESHFKTLIGKYWSDGMKDEEWKLITENDTDLIDKWIMLRTPMTCKTPNFKICKKCFGEKKIRTPYVGVTAGQCMTERLTQLLMRSFHKLV